MIQTSIGTAVSLAVEHAVHPEGFITSWGTLTLVLCAIWSQNGRLGALEVAADALHVGAESVQGRLFVQEPHSFFLLREQRHLRQLLLVLRMGSLEFIAEAGTLDSQIGNRLKRDAQGI
ncbi:hypothetical protein EYF80_046501 [Liparis tanakae]|uniref:Uncharacterized protein n=1 Tax=Liparis tanakae TaxID=230148 RepID=A0A4Z2FQW4_9TELE|nr:hypothetical protein EYF80_046501 [Liparis tanakae]